MRKPSTTPEEAELAAKNDELKRLSQFLAQKELDFEEIKNAVARFQHRYFAEIGQKYVELDDLRARIAEMKARHRPEDSVLKRKAKKAREQAKKSAEEYEGNVSKPGPASQKPEELDEAKKLYRKIASLIHPDKAVDDRSHHLRTRLMAELNEAYASNDIPRMWAILSRWEESPEAVSGEGTALDLVRTIRAIAQVRRRISEIEQEILKITISEIHILMVRVHEADTIGRNIFKEMAEALDAEIQAARDEIVNLRG